MPSNLPLSGTFLPSQFSRRDFQFQLQVALAGTQRVSSLDQIPDSRHMGTCTEGCNGTVQVKGENKNKSRNPHRVGLNGCVTMVIN